MEELINKYQRSITGFVRQKISDEGVVEELTQDILLAAFNAMPNFNGKCSEFYLWNC
jgi:DNA-directed RNA polymerase specialized sigma24 family protein